MRLKDKVAVVTGSGRGIGAAIARGFAQEGAHIVLISRTASQLEKQAEFIKQYGVQHLSIEADISKEKDVISIRKKVMEQLGRIDILVNAAGITMVSKSEELSLENWTKCLDINLTGTFLMCKELGGQMIEAANGGKIINITSIVSHAGIPERAAYSSSKGGVKQLSQTLAVEWAKHNIQVNTISPGFIVTEIVRDLISKGIHKPEKMVARIPAGRMGEVEDLAGPAIFLASSESNYVSGTTLIVDGGWMANGYV
ncbi:SDR family NAD(P)-dependent oxidoreductase [Chengkuizengella axinellae]|uniref:Glucose 1-dehydrogenase n=1 Tax=Chengkuizengella axinellae TaxID=3064388 RepID=A0ABT9IXG6_9BACL|nr:glucose 1-dehydrogenase [Chengkuizengella sp. 2205SS18-9]MDP5274056.1 glucose 1-dehydrogenase [Chengkuizengella sp. 2205SS18-9]